MVQDPSGLYRFETETDPGELGAAVLHLSLRGFIDAGSVQRMATEHVLASLEHTVVAVFDIDTLLDYRGRRPAMTFDRDHWDSFESPGLSLYRVLDADGVPFLLLAGLEPDYQWERFAAAVRELAVRLGVRTVVSANGIPMAVPHTRPVGLTPYASDPSLLPGHEPVFGRVLVPGNAEALLHLRLAEAGIRTCGFAVHVPHYLAEAEFGDAAVAGLEALNGVTGLRIPMVELVTAAGQNRAEIVAQVEDSVEVREVVLQLEQQYDTFLEGLRRRSLLVSDEASLPSADELGRQFEAFLRGVSTTGEEGPQDSQDSEGDADES